MTEESRIVVKLELSVPFTDQRIYEAMFERNWCADILAEIEALNTLPPPRVQTGSMDRMMRALERDGATPSAPPTTYMGIPVETDPRIPDGVAAIRRGNLFDDVIALDEEAADAARAFAQMLLIAGMATPEMRRKFLTV